jgi:predicted GNAT family acetyltransferase
MDVVTYCTAQSFLDRAGSFLLTAESANNLPLGVPLAIAAHRRVGGGFFATLEQRGAVVGAAVRTPPYKLLVTQMDDAAVDALVAYVTRGDMLLPGVHGETATATRFAEAYARVTERRARPQRTERVYEVSRVKEGALPAGTFRAAEIAEADRLGTWVEEFSSEVGLEMVVRERARQAAEAKIRRGELFVWDDGGAVSMAALTRPTPNGVAINSVYTPQDRRGRGYAKACVGALSRRELERGRRAVCLNADLANPISNRVYTQIGYQPVMDQLAVDFV